MRRPRTYRFDQLDDAAKQAARESFTGEGYLDHDWWEHVYSDAVECAENLGITIYNSGARTRAGTALNQPDIEFSGFWSQGDGARFVGKYEPPENPLAILAHAPEDKELHRIAEELTALQVAAKLEEHDCLHAEMKRDTYGGNYSHSGCMFVDVTAVDEDGNDKGEPTLFEVKGITQLMRDFADWIYRQLEKEHEWLHSDECVDELLADYKFDKDGALA